MSPLALLLLALLPTVGFILGVVLFRNPTTLSTSDRKELNAQRVLIGDLTALAGEHAGLGDAFAVIALDRISQHRREIQ